MSLREFDLKPSGAATGSAAGEWMTIPTLTMADVVVKATAESGTITAFAVWLEGSADGGTTAYEIPAERALELAGEATQNSSRAGERDIVPIAVTSPNGRTWMARYPHLPAGRVRLHWHLTGSTPSVTFAGRIAGK